jgi:hypothetical protein
MAANDHEAMNTLFFTGYLLTNLFEKPAAAPWHAREKRQAYRKRISA